jgi:predicted nuclease of predicted toxin-antitoxin system
MNWLVDAQLPKRILGLFRAAGHDAIHTFDLPSGNSTSDDEINAVAAQQNRVVVTKDSDFVNSHIAAGVPDRLLLVSTGNISNRDLEALLSAAIPQIEAAFSGAHFVELTRSDVVVHS